MARKANTAAFVLCVFLLLHFPEQGEGGPFRPRRQFVVDGSSWVNNYDGALTFRCDGSKQAISGLHSQHSNYYDDRQFRFECRDLPVGAIGLSSTSGYVNGWDQEFDFQCPDNGFMTGMQSYHSNYYDDRKWGFNCIKFNGYCWSHCEWLPYNGWDAEINIPAEYGRFFTGARSHHSNYYDDRQYSYQRCGVTRCY